MALYRPGKEPEKLKKRIKNLCDKLDIAYPDKNIVGLYQEHKKWGETVTALYRELGYTDGRAFLEAYGYQYNMKKSQNKGRPKNTDPEAIIKALQEKYPNGSPFKSADDLFEANPEYLPKLKTVKNLSNETFGMSLGKYLLSIGLIMSKAAFREADEIASETAPNPEKKKKIYLICRVKPTGLETEVYCFATTRSIHKGDYVEFPIRIGVPLVFGTVEETLPYDENYTLCDAEKTKTIVRKVGIREYDAGILRSILHVHAAVTTNELIQKTGAHPFQEEKSGIFENNDYIPWACIRGMATEVMQVLDSLVQKDEQIYSYTDLIMGDSGVSELYIYTDDVMSVMEKYPDLKMVMFAENRKTNIVNLYYSRSGFSVITDSYEIGSCDLQSHPIWTVRHSPAEDFKDDGVSYTFQFRDDWNAVNYVFSDEKNNRRQLGK